MSDHAGSTSSSAVAVMVEKTPSFLDDSLDLKKLMRELGKVSSAAVAVLLKALGSSDVKVAMVAADKLLAYQVEVAKAMSNDQMQRLIAEIKLAQGGRAKTLIPGEGNGPPRPMVDFENIREV